MRAGEISRSLLEPLCGEALGDEWRGGRGFPMARTNDACGAWVVELLDVASNDSVLEVGDAGAEPIC